MLRLQKLCSCNTYTVNREDDSGYGECVQCEALLPKQTESSFAESKYSLFLFKQLYLLVSTKNAFDAFLHKNVCILSVRRVFLTLVTTKNTN